MDNQNRSKVVNEFSEKLISEAFKQHFEDPKIKLSPNATKVLSKLMKIITGEAAKRAAYEAMKSNSTSVDVSHFEKVLAQLLLDL